MDMKTDTITIKEILEIYGFSKMSKGTTEEQWQQYHIDMLRHEEHYKNTEPKKAAYGYIGGMPPDAKHEAEFENAYSEWHMNRSCFEPNRPGYYRANND